MLCSSGGKYRGEQGEAGNKVPTRFPAPIVSSKILALDLKSAVFAASSPDLLIILGEIGIDKVPTLIWKKILIVLGKIPIRTRA
jgi:hypothetical protein